MDLKSYFNVDKTRSQLSMRLGEIIEAVIGDARLRELFDKQGGHPEEYEGKPTGLIALDMGIITSDTKTALLVAQAAERTLRLAERAEFVNLRRSEIIEFKPDLTEEKKYVVGYKNDIFKYVGSERDPEILRFAQATWQIAQENYNLEVRSVSDDMNYPNASFSALAIGEKGYQGLKSAAKNLYAVAAYLLLDAGHKHAHDKLLAVRNSIVIPTEGKTMFMPSQLAGQLASRDARAVMAANEYCGNFAYDLDYHRVMGSLAKLAKPSSQYIVSKIAHANTM